MLPLVLLRSLMTNRLNEMIFGLCVAMFSDVHIIKLNCLLELVGREAVFASVLLLLPDQLLE